MVDSGEIGAVRLSTRQRGVSPPVTRRLWISEQATFAQLHAVLQVAFDWSDTHLVAERDLDIEILKEVAANKW